MDFNLSAGMFASEKTFKPLDRDTVYDVLILGGGPAGLTAAVCMRKGVSTGIIVKDIGGQVAMTAEIENYMGYRLINGIDLVLKFKEQVLQSGIDYDEGSTAISIEEGAVKKVALDDGRIFSSRTVIVATGKSWRKLGVPGEDAFLGKGVAFCSTCDAPLFGGRTVVVVGGGNSGLEAVIDLARVAGEVILVHSHEKMAGDKVLIERVAGFKNVRIMYGREVTAISGGASVESVAVRNLKTGDMEQVAAQGVFVEIGLIPNSDVARGVLDLNDAGEIIVDSSCRTSLPGIFAAGDVTDVPFKQIIVAGGEGSKAALAACSYLLQRTGGPA